MDKEYLQSLYTPEQQLLLFGDANYFNNNDNNNLPFKSMVDMAAENANLDLFPAPQDFYTSPTYLMKQAQKFDQNPFRTGITASSNAIPFEQDPIAIAQGFVKGSPSDASFPGANFQFLESANEDEQDEVKEKSGIAKLFEFLSRFSPLNLVRGGLESLKTLNQKIRDNDFAQSKTMEEYLQKRKRRKETEFLGSDDPQGEIITYDPAKVRNRQRIMNIKPTAQDKARGRIGTKTKAPAPKRDLYREAKSAFFR
tara:strand:- start:66 stop:827 length:762 start_codon:yes stop_codon:yes gene_type:complete